MGSRGKLRISQINASKIKTFSGEEESIVSRREAISISNKILESSNNIIPPSPSTLIPIFPTQHPPHSTCHLLKEDVSCHCLLLVNLWNSHYQRAEIIVYSLI